MCYASWSRHTQIGSTPLQEEGSVPALLFKLSLLRQSRKLQKSVKDRGSFQLAEPKKQLGSAEIRHPGLRCKGKKSFLVLEWDIALFLTTAEHW